MLGHPKIKAGRHLLLYRRHQAKRLLLHRRSEKRRSLRHRHLSRRRRAGRPDGNPRHRGRGRAPRLCARMEPIFRRTPKIAASDCRHRHQRKNLRFLLHMRASPHGGLRHGTHRNRRILRRTSHLGLRLHNASAGGAVCPAFGYETGGKHVRGHGGFLARHLTGPAVQA